MPCIFAAIHRAARALVVEADKQEQSDQASGDEARPVAILHCVFQRRFTCVRRGGIVVRDRLACDCRPRLHHRREEVLNLIVAAHECGTPTHPPTSDSTARTTSGASIIQGDSCTRHVRELVVAWPWSASCAVRTCAERARMRVIAQIDAQLELAEEGHEPERGTRRRRSCPR